MDRDFKGVWIPKEIWLCKELSALDRVIYAEIDSYPKGLSISAIIILQNFVA